MVILLLTRTELDFLFQGREFTKPQKRCIRSRLNKKIKEFANNELPILVEKGLLDLTREVEPKGSDSLLTSRNFGLGPRL